MQLVATTLDNTAENTSVSMDSSIGQFALERWGKSPSRSVCLFIPWLVPKRIWSSWGQPEAMSSVPSGWRWEGWHVGWTGSQSGVAEKKQPQWAELRSPDRKWEGRRRWGCCGSECQRTRPWAVTCWAVRELWERRSLFPLAIYGYLTCLIK